MKLPPSKQSSTSSPACSVHSISSLACQRKRESTGNGKIQTSWNDHHNKHIGRSADGSSTSERTNSFPQQCPRAQQIAPTLGYARAILYPPHFAFFSDPLKMSVHWESRESVHSLFPKLYHASAPSTFLIHLSTSNGRVFIGNQEISSIPSKKRVSSANLGNAGARLHNSRLSRSLFAQQRAFSG